MRITKIMFEHSTTNLTFAAALISGIVGFSVGVSAAPLQTESVFYLDDDSDYVSEGWQVEGRIGGRSTWEVGIGTNTHSNSGMQNTHVTWRNGISEGFALNWDGSDAVFQIGDKSVSWSGLEGEFNAIRIRAKVSGADGRKLDIGTSVTLSDILLDGAAPSIDSVGLTSTDSYQDQRLYLFQSDPFDAFELTGDITFAWDEGGVDPFQRNAQSRVQFFIDVGNRSFALQDGGLDDPVAGAVPLPGALALMLAGVAMAPALRKKRG